MRDLRKGRTGLRSPAGGLSSTDCAALHRIETSVLRLRLSRDKDLVACIRSCAKSSGIGDPGTFTVGYFFLAFGLSSGSTYLSRKRRSSCLLSGCPSPSMSTSSLIFRSFPSRRVLVGEYPILYCVRSSAEMLCII